MAEVRCPYCKAPMVVNAPDVPGGSVFWITCRRCGNRLSVTVRRSLEDVSLGGVSMGLMAATTYEVSQPEPVVRLSDCFLCGGNPDTDCRVCPTRPREGGGVVGEALTDRQRRIVNANKMASGKMTLTVARAIRNEVRAKGQHTKAWRICRNVFQQIENQRRAVCRAVGSVADADAWTVTLAQQQDLERAQFLAAAERSCAVCDANA